MLFSRAKAPACPLPPVQSSKGLTDLDLPLLARLGIDAGAEPAGPGAPPIHLRNHSLGPYQAGKPVATWVSSLLEEAKRQGGSSVWAALKVGQQASAGHFWVALLDTTATPRPKLYFWEPLEGGTRSGAGIAASAFRSLAEAAAAHAVEPVDVPVRVQQDGHSCGVWACYLAQQWAQWHRANHTGSFQGWMQAAAVDAATVPSQFLQYVVEALEKLA